MPGELASSFSLSPLEIKGLDSKPEINCPSVSKKRTKSSLVGIACHQITGFREKEDTWGLNSPDMWIFSQSNRPRGTESQGGPGRRA